MNMCSLWRLNGWASHQPSMKETQAVRHTFMCAPLGLACVHVYPRSQAVSHKEHSWRKPEVTQGAAINLVLPENHPASCKHASTLQGIGLPCRYVHALENKTVELNWTKLTVLQKKKKKYVPWPTPVLQSSTLPQKFKVHTSCQFLTSTYGIVGSCTTHFNQIPYQLPIQGSWTPHQYPHHLYQQLVVRAFKDR